MTDTSPAQKLTDNLLSVIRQQRHLATRVLISTQEPTISPKLLDLCNVIIAHRFTSPEWLSFMKRHLAAIAVEAESNALLERIVALNEGEAYLFAPAGIISNRDFEPIYGQDDPEGEGGSDEDENEDVGKLGLGYLKVKVRKRLTEDGGKSILANSVAAPIAARTAGVIPAEIAAAMVNKKTNSSRGGRYGGGERGGRGGGQYGAGSSGRLPPPPFNPPPNRNQPPPLAQSQQPAAPPAPPAPVAQSQSAQSQPPPPPPAQPQRNGGGARQSSGWDQWDYQSQQNDHQQQNGGTWDPDYGVVNKAAPKKDPIPKATKKKAAVGRSRAAPANS